MTEKLSIEQIARGVVSAEPEEKAVHAKMFADEMRRSYGLTHSEVQRFCLEFDGEAPPVAVAANILSQRMAAEGKGGQSVVVSSVDQNPSVTVIIPKDAIKIELTAPVNVTAEFPDFPDWPEFPAFPAMPEPPPAQVTVEPMDVHITPEISVNAPEVTVQSPQVTVNPELKITDGAITLSQESPNIEVVPNVTIETKKKTIKFSRDANGKISHAVVEEG